MRAGGIFGSRAPTGLGLVDVNMEKDADRQLVCDFATKLGVAHRTASLAPTDITPLVAKNFAADSNSELMQLAADCYLAAYNQTLATPAESGSEGLTSAATNWYGAQMERIAAEEQKKREEAEASGQEYISPVAGQACSSAEAISFVQSQIGTKVDGKWGPKSQAALDKSGKSFNQIATGCTGNVPQYSASGGGTTVTSTVTPGPGGGGGGGGGLLPASSQGVSKYLDPKSPMLWAGVLAVGVVGYYLVTKKGRGNRQ